MSKIELSELIVELRRELLEARARGEREDLRFQVEEVEIEVNLATTKEGSAKTGVKFWVLNAETQGKLAAETVQKVRIKLKPLDAAGGPTLVSDEDER